MRKSGICFCGAQLFDETRINNKFVLCTSCGREVQMYKKEDRVYPVDFVTSNELDRRSFIARAEKAGLFDITYEPTPDDRTSAAVSALVRYNVRGNWRMDIRRKIASSLTAAGIVTSPKQVRVGRAVTVTASTV